MNANYENYKKRMEKVRRVLGVVYRFRVLIISVVALIAATVIALMATNGIVYGEVPPPPEITYGEQLSYESNAFMSGVTYEYCEAGKENDPSAWTKKAPRYAGTYSVRAVSTRTFGSPSYGKTYKFTIKPLEVTLGVADEVVYGERPVLSGGLINGDTITDFNYEYDAIDAKETTVYIDSVKAVSTDGVDVSGSYVFKSEPESILFIRREITVNITDKTKYYDGTPLTSDDYTVSVGSLADGDMLSVLCDGEITEAGSAENIPSFTVMHNDTDVSVQYKITARPGTLTVEPRPITVKTASDSWVYDGEKHVNTDYEIISELTAVSGETISVSNSIGIVDAGETENIIILSVQKEDETDSTANYSFTYEYGTLTVLKRTVGIKTESYSWVYDGENHGLSGFTIVSDIGLADGEISSVKRFTQISEVGTADNIVIPQVVKANGDDSTDNYSFVLSEDDTGVLTVTPRPITVKTKTSGRIYDGTVFNDEDIEITSPLKLADCDKIKLSSVAGITDVGSVLNEIIIGIEKKAGGNSTGNYTIDYDYGTLTVEKRPVTVETATNSWTYDGTVKWDDRFTVTSELKIAEGESIVVSNPATIKNVGSAVNTMTVEVKKSGGEDSTDNYDITTVEGSLTVTACTVTLLTSSDEWDYDGTVHYNEGYTVTSDIGFSAHDTVTVTSHTEIKNAGSVQNALEIEILSPDGTDAKDNYDITVELGTLTVKPIDIEVKADSLEVMYDGKEHVVNTYTVKVGGVKKTDGDNALVGGDIIGVIMPEFSAKDVTGEDGIETTLSVKLCSADGSELISPERDNYVLSVEFGTLKITSRPISVLTASHTWVYDGKVHFDENYEITSEIKLAEGQTASVVNRTEVKKAVIMKSNTLELDITDTSGASVIHNYFIIYTFGTLTVDKRPITLTAGSESKVYDGEELSKKSLIISAGIYNGSKLDNIFADGENITSSYAMTACSVIINAGSVPNVIDRSSIVISDGVEDTTDNYDITFEDGVLEITVRPILITTNSKEWVYDGEYHYDEGYAAACEYGAAIVARDTATVIDRTEIIDRGEKPNVFALQITTDTGESSDNNYYVTYLYGTLTVTRREITIKTASSSHVYDGEAYFDIGYTVTSELGITARDQVFVVQRTYITDVGKAENKINFDIKEKSGELNTARNYDITYVWGELEVTPRPITIQTATNRWVYDGQTHFDDGCEVISPLKIVSGERLEVIGRTGVLLYTPKPVPNEQRVQILKADGTDSTGNYEISFELGELTIDRRPITITAASGSKPYDGTPLTNGDYVLAPGEYNGEVLSSALADNETITLSMTAGSTITNVGKVKNEIDFDSIVIFNLLKNTDRTDNYDVTLIDGELEITPVYINIIALSDSKIYDGLPLELNTFLVMMEGYDLEEDNGVYRLVNGEYMVVYMDTFSITNVRESGLETHIKSIALFDLDGVPLDEERISNYDIWSFNGRLTIDPRPITVKSGTKSFEYDGEEHTYEYITVSSDLKIVDGENYTIHDATAVINYTHDPVDNMLYITIAKASGADSTDNYDITYEYGKISVTKRLVAFLTAENSFVYNGQWQFDEGYEVLINDPDVYRIFRRYSMPVVDGEIVVVTSHTEVKYVTDNPVQNILGFRIDKADGSDSTDNYTVIVFVATLSVTPRTVTLTAGSAEKVYDGSVLTCLDYELKDGENEDEGLADGDNIEIAMTEGSAIGRVGSVKNVIDITATRIFCGEGDDAVDVTFNYNFVTFDGTLTVTVRKITVTAGSSAKAYDGLPLTLHDISSVYVDEDGNEDTGIAPTDTPEYEMTAGSTITEVGEVDNVIDRATFRIYNDDLGDVTDCYEIEFKDGLLAVVECNIVITVGSASKEYDGTPLTVDDYTVVIEGELQPVSDKYYLADGSYFVVLMETYTATHVTDTTGTTIQGIEVYKKNGVRFSEEEEAMFVVTVVEGMIEITPRQITVETLDNMWIYDGGEHYELGYKIVSDNKLIDGDIMSVLYYPTITEIGDVENMHTYLILNGEGLDVTQDYTIVFGHVGRLVVNPIPITIYTGDAQKIYDGSPLTNVVYSVDGKLLDGHTVHVTVTGSQTDLGSSENTAEAVVTDGEGNDCSEYYEFIYMLGTLTVYDNELTLKTGSDEKVYDGKPLTKDEYWVEGLPDGYKVNATVTGTITFAGSVLNCVDEENITVIFESTGEDVTHKFKINYEYGNLTVLQRKLTIKTASAEKEYDGTPLTANEFDITDGELLVTDNLTVTVTGSQTAVGRSDNTAECVIINSYSGEVVTDSYDITFEFGTLTVTGDGSGDGEDGEGGDLSGDLSGGRPSANPIPVFTIDTEFIGQMYLRYMSYGNYDGKNWDTAIPAYLDTDISALYYGAEALRASDKKSYSTKVTIYKNESGKLATKNFLMPYYALYESMQDAQKNNKNDIIISGSYEEYAFTHYPFAYSSASELTTIDIPSEYRSYVYENYLGVNESTGLYLKKNILDKNPSFTADNPDVINLIAEYVASSATYNGEYDSAIDEADDRVIAFVEYGEGVCRHYASLATILYRMIGIPARYTIGYAVGSSGGEQLVKSDKAHAWVEVFVDGIGWVHVEVTGGGGGDSKPILSIKPVDISKEYDGTPLDASEGEQKVEGADEAGRALLDRLLSAGYTYEAQLSGSRTDVGASLSVIESFKLFNELHEDVTSEFGVLYSTGMVEITPPQLRITALDLSKVYDGTPLKYDVTQPHYEITLKPDLVASAELDLSEMSATLPRESITAQQYYDYNTDILRLYDKNGQQLPNENFYVVIEGGLTVTKRQLTIKTVSAEKEYDGEPLTAPEYEITSGELLPTDTLYVTVMGSQTDIGKSDNTAECTIKNTFSGEDVTDAYDITFELGTLTVTGDESGGGDLSGDLAGGDPSDNPVPVFTLSTEFRGQMYLRYMSYGNYDGKNWDNAVEPYLDTELSALYYGAQALRASDKTAYKTTVTIYKNDSGRLATRNFIMPYYALYDDMQEAQRQNKNDIVIEDSYEAYTFTHYPFTYSSKSALTRIEIPADYRSYVYENYLGVKESTGQYLKEKILDKNPSFTAANPDVIDQIAAYVASSATYNGKYDSSIDDAEDRVIAFLEVGEGVCRHYASLATLLYRMIGIPARYTIGYSVTSSGNGEQLVQSDTGHAWVEVFVDGIGWVHVEVTGGGAGGNADKPKLTIKPTDINKEYDGTPLDASEGEQVVVGADSESRVALSTLLAKGYTYEAHFSGSRTDYGVGISVIESFKLFNELGEDVTNKFNIIFETGLIEITTTQVKIFVLDLSKTYDGTPLKYNTAKRYFVIDEAPDIIASCELDLSEMSVTTPAESMTVKEYYESNNDILHFYDADGNEVRRDNFYIDFEGGLTVTKRLLTITAMSRQKAYDGNALTCSESIISSGSLIGGHYYEAVISGSIVDIGSTANVIESVVIYDADGKDVTEYYDVTVKAGTLTVT
ncbi:MAG: transglutaminase domain-containing protein [Clostridiales bacterium]|nr:transglutaminase domain-containing protein [Clostridiales bacterium]